MSRDGALEVELRLPARGDQDQGPGQGPGEGSVIRRRYLEDGDELILSGFAQLPDGSRVGFGSVSGKVLPAEEFVAMPFKSNHQSD